MIVWYALGTILILRLIVSTIIKRRNRKLVDTITGFSLDIKNRDLQDLRLFKELLERALRHGYSFSVYHLEQQIHIPRYTVEGIFVERFLSEYLYSVGFRNLWLGERDKRLLARELQIVEKQIQKLESEASIDPYDRLSAEIEKASASVTQTVGI